MSSSVFESSKLLGFFSVLYINFSFAFSLQSFLFYNFCLFFFVL